MDKKLTKAEKKEQRKQERQAFEEQMKKAETNAKLKKFGFWGLGILILILAVWGLITLVNAPTEQTVVLTAPKVTNKDMVTGNANAPVTLIEYADFQCPACEAYYPLVKKLQTDFDGKLRLVYRFFPLETLHQHALISAQAAYAASLQGKFWEMHDLLFEHQNDWANALDPRSIFDGYAKQLGLNVDKFNQDMNASSTKSFIADQENVGTQIGVNATPTFFVNGKSIQNPESYNAFKQIIQNAVTGRK